MSSRRFGPIVSALLVAAGVAVAASTVSVSISDTARQIVAAVPNLAVTETGTDWDWRAVNVTTAEVQHALSSGISTAGYAFVYNRSTTNYVDVGLASATYFSRLKPGRVALLPLAPATTSLWMQAGAGGASCLVEVYVRED